MSHVMHNKVKCMTFTELHLCRLNTLFEQFRVIWMDDDSKLRIKLTFLKEKPMPKYYENKSTGSVVA